MVRRWKPDRIEDLARFAADLEAMHATLRSYSDRLRTSSPHFWPVMDLQSRVVDTIKEVTGEGPSWTAGTATLSGQPSRDRDK